MNKIFREQQRLQDVMNNPMGKGEEAIKNNIFAMAVEGVEVLDEINWKPWKKQRKRVDPQKVHEELVDCLQFLVNAMIASGMSANDVNWIIERKWEINHRRVKDGY